MPERFPNSGDIRHPLYTNNHCLSKVQTAEESALSHRYLYIPSFTQHSNARTQVVVDEHLIEGNIKDNNHHRGGEKSIQVETEKSVPLIISLFGPTTVPLGSGPQDLLLMLYDKITDTYYQTRETWTVHVTNG